MATVREKVTAEKVALDANLVKLEAFIASDKVKQLTSAEARLLNKQQKSMKEYSEVLKDRLAILPAIDLEKEDA
jgi:hypothetical protein